MCCCSDSSREAEITAIHTHRNHCARAGAWVMSSVQHSSVLKGKEMSLSLPETQQAERLLHSWLRALQLPQRTHLGQHQSPCTQGQCWKSACLVRDKRRVKKRQEGHRAGPADQSGPRDVPCSLGILLYINWGKTGWASLSGC